MQTDMVQIEALLERLVDLECLSAIDVHAARQMSPKNEALRLSFAYLFCAARAGHLCVQLSPFLLPDLKQLWPVDGFDLEDLSRQITTGFKQLDVEHPMVTQLGHRVYINRHLEIENQLQDAIHKCLSSSPSLYVESIEKMKGLTDEQQHVIENSLKYGFSLIAGGPGVGKTFTAAKITEAFLSLFPKASVAVVAPTGKAVANLKARFAHLEEDFHIEAMTLHRLLMRKITSSLAYDLIIVDESSMLDAEMMLKLLQVHKPSSRLIFMGDPDQLPPVGIGSVFNDFLSAQYPSSRLTKCLRTDIKEILEVARAVNLGDDALFIQQLNQQNRLRELTKPVDVIEHIINQFPIFDAGASAVSNLASLSKYRVLTSMKRGAYGSEALNKQICERLGPNNPQPIMITSNNPRLDLYNGDIGWKLNSKEALFDLRHPKECFADPNERVRRIPVSLLSAYEPAYCLSIHKSQGSEYEHVTLVIPESSEVFGRGLLYTGLTRVKKDFEVFSNNSTLQKLVRNKVVRLSGLNTRTPDE